MKKRLRLLTHSVVLQLLIGAFIKTFYQGAPSLEANLSWTTFSVIGLFMLVGLQIHPEKFKKDFKLSASLVGWTTAVPLALYYGASKFFGLPDLEAWTVSAVLITTGTGVTIQTLSDLGLLKQKVGEFIVLISALDDIPAAVVMGLLLSTSASSSPEASLIKVKFLIGFLLLFIIMFVLKNRDFKYKSAVNSLLYLSFGLCFSKFIEAFHISLVMGGLMSGFIISMIFGSIDEETDSFMSKMLKPVLILYMIFIGMKLSPSILKSQWMLIYAVTFIILCVVSKWVLTFLILKKREDLHPEIAAWGMVPRGIPGFAFASAAVAAGLISNDLFTVLILIVSATTWIGLIGIEVSARKKNLIRI